MFLYPFLSSSLIEWVWGRELIKMMGSRDRLLSSCNVCLFIFPVCVCVLSVVLDQISGRVGLIIVPDICIERAHKNDGVPG